MIRLTPENIVKHWDIIKHALVRGDMITPDQRQSVLNDMLHELLCERAQCFFRYGMDDRKIQSIIITKIQRNDRTLEKFLYIQCLYSFKVVKHTYWQEDWDFIKAFAKETDCHSILMNSYNVRVFKLLSRLGVKESYRTFLYNLNEEVSNE